MKLLKLTAMLLAVSLIVSVPMAKGAAFVIWDREADWTSNPDTQSPGGPTNPSPDSGNNPTYNHVWAAGEGLDGPMADRWYVQPGTPMVWDPEWAGDDEKLVWAQEDDVLPIIRWDMMVQVTSGWTRKNAPVVQWQNPMGATIAVTVTGSFALQWFGTYGAEPTVDVVVARIGSAPDDVEDLATWTVSRGDATPIEGSETGMSMLLQGLSTPAFVVEPDDMIVWSLRTRDFNQGPDTIVRAFDNVVITQVDMGEVVPEPMTVGLLLCGALGLLAKRRRNRRRATI